MHHFSLKTVKLSALALLLQAVTMNVFSQSTGSLDDSFPSISMPTITAPSIGGQSYMPGTLNNRANSGDKKTDTDKKDASNNKTAKTDIDDLSAAGASLTAQDLTALNSLGLLDSLNTSMGLSTDSAQVLLKKLLKEMEELKEKNGKDTEEYKAKQSSDTPAADLVAADSSSKEDKPESKVPVARLLRFNVNGYDLLRTCAKVYISAVQTDGTFLVTGDRRYMSDGKLRTETFHILFKPQKESNSFSNYAAAVSVTQDYLNQYSFVYQLSQKENLSATRIGNLVTMRVNEPNWQLEFLVDLGDK